MASATTFNDLPTELIVDIFLALHAAVGKIAGDGLGAILLVCRLWNSIAMGTPPLWTGVRLRQAFLRKLTGNLRRTQFASRIERSGDLPLEVYLTEDVNQIKALEVLAPYSDRWGSLIVCSPLLRPYGRTDTTIPFLNQLQSLRLPRLTEFKIQTPSPHVGVRYVYIQAPKLQVFSCGTARILPITEPAPPLASLDIEWPLLFYKEEVRQLIVSSKDTLESLRLPTPRLGSRRLEGKLVTELTVQGYLPQTHPDTNPTSLPKLRVLEWLNVQSSELESFEASAEALLQRAPDLRRLTLQHQDPLFSIPSITHRLPGCIYDGSICPHIEQLHVGLIPLHYIEGAALARPNLKHIHVSSRCPDDIQFQGTQTQYDTKIAQIQRLKRRVTLELPPGDLDWPEGVKWVQISPRPTVGTRLRQERDLASAQATRWASEPPDPRLNAGGGFWADDSD